MPCTMAVRLKIFPTAYWDFFDEILTQNTSGVSDGQVRNTVRFSKNTAFTLFLFQSRTDNLDVKIGMIPDHRKLMKQSIIEKMREEGLKLTPQRMAVIEVLIENPFHPSANLIYHEARNKVKSLSLSTVYSVLNELSKHGIIKMLEFDKMENRYETNTALHINLICKGCKKIADYKFPFRIDTDDVKKKSGFRVTDSRFEYYGYCQECGKK
jgi:Fur family transcriptional regulator, peroxide stress response regulator